MKRGRISRATDSNSTRGINDDDKVYGNATHIQVHYSGPSFSDLPADIFQSILLKLPIKSVVVCKSVCKTWHAFTSDPEFAKRHFDETCDLVHPLYQISDSTIYYPQPDEENFRLKIGICEHTHPNPGCVCNVKFSLHTKCELPIDDQYSIVNSCNGLLCFSLGAHNAAVIICNPVLGEFINLPKDKKANDSCGGFINYGFGFSRTDNKYKVVKIIRNRWGNSTTARVHIAGTEAWRDICIESYFIHGRPTYVRGLLYWFLSPLSFVFFDVENECFGLDQGPQLLDFYTHQWTSVGVFAGELCISFYTCFWTFHVWAKKGVEKSWSRVLSIDMLYGKHIGHPLPMKHLSDGSLLMFNIEGKALVLVDPIKCKFRYFNMESKVEAIFAHVPSLISLEHFQSGNDTKVLNLHSRREELKLHKQAKDLQLYAIET